MPSVIQKLDSEVAKAEGGKVETSVGNVRSVRMNIQKALAKDPEKLSAFLKGIDRIKRLIK